MIRYWLVLLGLILFNALHAQQSNSEDTDPSRSIISYVEFGGHTRHITANVEYVFTTKGHYSYSAWVGIGGGRYGDYWEKQNVFAVPVGVSIFRGWHAHHLEVNLGLTYVKGEYVDGIDKSKGLLLAPAVGYRYQNPSNNFFCKILFTPVFKVAEFSPIEYKIQLSDYLPVGICLGYNFPLKGHRN